MDVYGSSIHNHPNLKTTKMSLNRWIKKKKMWLINTVGYYSAIKKKKNQTKNPNCKNNNKNLKYWFTQLYRLLLNACCLVKEARLKRLHVINSPFWKGQNYRDRKQISDCQGLGEREMLPKKESQKGFLRWLNSSVWYCVSGYPTLCICQNPWNGPNQKVNFVYCVQLFFESQPTCQVITGWNVYCNKKYNYIIIVGYNLPEGYAKVADLSNFGKRCFDLML